MNNIPLPPSENLISSDMAESEFNRFTDAMDLDVDTSCMDIEDKTTFEKQKRRLIKALQNGSLVINDNGEPVYTPQKSTPNEPLVFHEQTGAALMSMDRLKKNHDVAKTYAVMGNICKVPQDVFAKMKGIDIKICMIIFSLLMD